MTDTEGVIQYQLDHHPGELPVEGDYAGLFRWFRQCRSQGLLGQDPARYQGYAYGNISVRSGSGFVISGTQTGGLKQLGRENLAWVASFDAAANRLRSLGPARPSSEAMTHGEVYRALPDVSAVIHAHSPEIWSCATALSLPTTPPEAAYGTPAMAAAVTAILLDNPVAGVLSMGGHEDGIIAYASDMDTVGRRLLETLQRARNLLAGT